MGKSGGLARLPKEQRCQFMIGPLSSWFMPNISDIWTQPKHCTESSQLSYFVYGSIGCFSYGEIHQNCHVSNVKSIYALINSLIDVKEDNSRVSCVRFLRGSIYPLVMVLTENGSLLIHDCMSASTLVHYRKSELVTRLIGDSNVHVINDDQHCNKKARFVTQQINSFVWPKAGHAFLGISLVKSRTNLLFWLKLKDLTSKDTDRTDVTKDNLIISQEKIELDLDQYSPICCMDSSMLDHETILIAMAMDHGLIVIVKINLLTGKWSINKLSRHNDQISSLSIYTGDILRFPSGLLASASRGGLVLLWDIENEFYFADYQALPDGARSKINWFALRLIPAIDSKNIHLAVSNCDSGLTILEVPEKTRSKIRLKENKEKKDRRPGSETLRHHALIFDIVFDSSSNILATSSLDGIHVFWKCNQVENSNENNKKKSISIKLKPEYLLPSMHNNSRTHMMRYNPIKEDLLALALGKAGIRFYKISATPTERRYDMNTSCALIARKVAKASLSPTSVCWSPSHEYKLAIGTIEGKVLLADLTPSKANMIECEKSTVMRPKQNQELKTIEDPFEVEYVPAKREETFSGEDSRPTENLLKTDGVYSLCWGPNPDCPSDLSRLAIYAVGSLSHKLFIYYNQSDNKEKLVDHMDRLAECGIPEAFDMASEVSWKPSLDLMALGTTHGKIIIVGYSTSTNSEHGTSLFRRLVVIEGPLGTSYIQCLAWHPTADRDDAHYYQIAASANESPVFVFNIDEDMLAVDVKEKLVIDEGQDTKNYIISSYKYKLDAHKKAVSDIQWNPHEPNQLATASFDRNCYVWSLDSISKVASYITAKFSARDRLFTLEWSLVDQDLILTSGHDSTIWAWRPSENQFYDQTCHHTN